MHDTVLVVAASAGQRPSDRVNPKAVKAMKERGYDLVGNVSEGLGVFNGLHVDVAVTMRCGDEGLLVLADQCGDWKISDPRSMTSEGLCGIRDRMEKKAKVLLASLKIVLLCVAWALGLQAAAVESTSVMPQPAEDIPETDLPASGMGFVDLFNGRDLTGWVNVNTAPDTWSVKDGLLVCSGQPIGVMRSARQYENFILHIEWRHMKPGGNSGVFVWSEARITDASRLPKGMEVQMLELDWVNQHPLKNGEPNHRGYISGELFGAGGLTATPTNRRGNRSMSYELRCKGYGKWNVYDVVCVDGTVKLSINGKFVNSITDSSVRKGYLCLESEGSEIHFRNIRILELPAGITSAEQTAEVVE
jgi:protein-tyrosine-phosphatase